MFSGHFIRYFRCTVFNTSSLHSVHGRNFYTQVNMKRQKNQNILNFFKPKPNRPLSDLAATENVKEKKNTGVSPPKKKKGDVNVKTPEKNKVKPMERLTPKIDKMSNQLSAASIESSSKSSSKSSDQENKLQLTPQKKRKIKRVIESSEEEVDTQSTASTPVKVKDAAVLQFAPKVLESLSSSSEDESPPEVFKKKKKGPTKNIKKREKSSPQSKKVKPSTSIEKPVKSESKLKKQESDEVGEPVKISKYDPSSPNFKPKRDMCWKPNTQVPYAALTKTFHLISSTTKRLEKTRILSNHLSAILHNNDEIELSTAIHMCVNSVAPEYTGIELGIGDMILCKGIGEATGSKPTRVKEEARSRCDGDLGDYAEYAKTRQKQMFTKPKSLTCTEVFGKLKEIASISGEKSQARKAAVIKGLLVNCSNQYEALFLVRSLGGKLRIQLAHATLLQALSDAAYKYFVKLKKEGTVKDAESNIKTAYVEHPDFELLANTLVQHGWNELEKYIHLLPGVPTKPMLAHPTKGIDEVLKRFDTAGEFTCEWKYDGERAQIHVQDHGKSVTIYSRNQENHTTKYPDIIARMREILDHEDCYVESCILDSEAVAYDREKDQLLPFQKLTTRKKKDVELEDIKVQVCVYAFDLLFLNGEPLIRKPFGHRRKLLRESFPTLPGKFIFAQGKDCTDPNDIQDELDASMKGGCEGLMVKTLHTDALYEIANRSRSWLKLKKDYLDGVGDTLDLVLIGAWKGKGKRGKSFGAYLLACYDEDDDEYQAICKVGTGFKDEDLAEIYSRAKEYEIPDAKPYYQFADNQKDIKDITWLEPKEVWEIKCADLTLSPVYKAAYGSAQPGKGISLRFPRFERKRDDKNISQATTASQVLDMYFNQDQMKM